MKYAKKIRELLQRVYRSEADRPGPMDERTLSDAYATMKRAVTSHQSRLRIVLWRRIMKSPYTRTAAVLAIGLAVFSVLFPTRNGLIPESVALADVQKAVQAQETVFVTGTRTITFAEKPTFVPPGLESLFEKPVEEDGSFRLEFAAETYMTPKGVVGKFLTRDGQLLFQGSIHNETGKAIVLLPTAKAFIRFDMLAAYPERMAGFTIQGFIDMIYKSGDYRKVGPRRVQGIDAVGFEVSGWDKRILEGFNPYIVKLLFNLEEGTGRIWIDPETNLPIQSESEVLLKACVLSFFKDADVKQIDDHFEWGVEIDEELFDPEIPEDYQELSPPSGAAIGVAASSVVLAGVAPWCVLIHRRRRRRKVCVMM
jgi:hypothetical protein